jgi:hypothetical protein
MGVFDYASGSEGNIMGWDDHGCARDRTMRYLNEAQAPLLHEIA